MQSVCNFNSSGLERKIQSTFFQRSQLQGNVVQYVGGPELGDPDEHLASVGRQVESQLV